MQVSNLFPITKRPVQFTGKQANPNKLTGLQRDTVSLSQRPTSAAQHSVQFAGNCMIRSNKLPPALKLFYIDKHSEGEPAMGKYHQNVSALYSELRPILENEYGSDVITQCSEYSAPFYTSYLLMNIKAENQNRMVESIFRAKQDAGARLEPNIQWLKLPRAHNSPVQKIISFPSPSVEGKRIAIVLTDPIPVGAEFTSK